MFDPTRNFTLLRLLYHSARLRAALARRNLGVQQATQNRSGFYEEVWREAAGELGATLEPLGYGICEIRRGDAVVRVFENYCPLEDAVALCIAGKKPLVYRLLAREGLPVPRHAEFTLRTIARAVEFLESAGGPCVVKPCHDTGAGRGVTTGIRTRRQLARAAVTAALHGGELLIEQQVPGDCYRLLYLEGELLDAVRRGPPTVVGNGKSSIRELIHEANAERLRQGRTFAQVLIPEDLDMVHTLREQGLSLASVPGPGVVVPVKTVINDNSAPENISATGLLCEAIIRDGVRAARAVGSRLAGVDILTRNPAIPLAESGGVVLEVNTTPGYHYHYHRKDGPTRVAIPILTRLLARCQDGAGVVSRP